MKYPSTVQCSVWCYCYCCCCNSIVTKYDARMVSEVLFFFLSVFDQCSCQLLLLYVSFVNISCDNNTIEIRKIVNFRFISIHFFSPCLIFISVFSSFLFVRFMSRSQMMMKSSARSSHPLFYSFFYIYKNNFIILLLFFFLCWIKKIQIYIVIFSLARFEKRASSCFLAHHIFLFSLFCFIIVVYIFSVFTILLCAVFKRLALLTPLANMFRSRVFFYFGPLFKRIVSIRSFFINIFIFSVHYYCYYYSCCQEN